MKKVFSMLTVATFAGVLVFSACSKKSSDAKGTYTCKCTITVGGQTTTSSTPFSNATKSEAQTACNNAQTSAQNSAGSSGSVTCSLN